MAIKYNFTLDKGTDHTFFMEFQSMDGSRMNLRSFNINMHIKQGAYGKALDELSTENGRLILSSTENDIVFDCVQVIFPNEVTDKFPVGTLLYDLEIKASKSITRILEGKIKCTSNITV